MWLLFGTVLMYHILSSVFAEDFNATGKIYITYSDRNTKEGLRIVYLAEKKPGLDNRYSLLGRAYITVYELTSELHLNPLDESYGFKKYIGRNPMNLKQYDNHGYYYFDDRESNTTVTSGKWFQYTVNIAYRNGLVGKDELNYYQIPETVAYCELSDHQSASNCYQVLIQEQSFTTVPSSPVRSTTPVDTTTRRVYYTSDQSTLSILSSTAPLLGQVSDRKQESAHEGVLGYSIAVSICGLAVIVACVLVVKWFCCPSDKSSTNQQMRRRSDIISADTEDRTTSIYQDRAVRPNVAHIPWVGTTRSLPHADADILPAYGDVIHSYPDNQTDSLPKYYIAVRDYPIIDPTTNTYIDGQLFHIQDSHPV